MPKVSIIIPVYNAEKYLNRCLVSAQNQTETDIEIICINDGSTDSSGTICDSYAQTDSRFVIVHQKNAGVSVARNIGLDIAKGKYIAFLDADDALQTEMIQTCLEAMNKTPVEMIMFAAKAINEQGKYVKTIQPNVYNSEFVTIPERFFATRDTLYTIWNKLYSKEFLQVHNLRFVEGVRNEDAIFSIETAFSTSNFRYLDVPLYNYYLNIGYSTDHATIPVGYDTLIRMNQERIKRVLRFNPPQNILNILYNDKYTACRHVYKRSLNKTVTQQQILDSISEDEWEQLGCRTIKVSWKNRLFIYWLKDGLLGLFR